MIAISNRTEKKLNNIEEKNIFKTPIKKKESTLENEFESNNHFLKELEEFEIQKENSEKLKSNLIRLNHHEKLLLDNFRKEKNYFEEEQQKTFFLIQEYNLELNSLSESVKKKEDNIKILNSEF
jgi:hypothetical protein